MAYSNLIHKSLVYDIEHIFDYDEEAQREIRSMLKKYGNFPLDYLNLYFDEDEVFEMYEDDPEAVESGNILAVDMFPVLPKGMWLFG